MPPSSLAAVSLIDSSLVLIGGFNRVADADLAQLHLCRLAGSAPGDQRSPRQLTAASELD